MIGVTDLDVFRFCRCLRHVGKVWGAVGVVQCMVRGAGLQGAWGWCQVSPEAVGHLLRCCAVLRRTQVMILIVVALVGCIYFSTIQRCVDRRAWCAGMAGGS